MKYLIDTNIVISYLIGKNSVVNYINSLSDTSLYISYISIAELFYGAYKSQYPQKNLTYINEFINSPEISLVNLDTNICEIYGSTFDLLEKSGLKINPIDLIIASCAKSINSILLTTDKKHLSRLNEYGFEVKIIE